MASEKPKPDRPSVAETIDVQGALPPTIVPDSTDLEPDQIVLTATQATTALPEILTDGNRVVVRPRQQLRYESDTLLGRGGMGEVQLARDHDIGRSVAVKRLLNSDNPTAIARFVDEVRTVGSLEHPNIVPIHDVGIDADGSLFFVMKYVEGETLESIIQKLGSGDKGYHRRYSFETRIDLFAGLIRALQYAHEQGLIHRDLKPANIMVGRFGEVMLMDWGIARRFGHRMPEDDISATTTETADRASTKTIDGTVIGTPQYMSPEQADGETDTLDGRSDLYSAFVVLFELLTTRTFDEPGTHTMQLILHARDRQPPKTLDPAYDNPYQPAVPSELRHFLRRGLAHSKQDRFANAEEVLHELERIRSGNCAIHCPMTFVKANNTRFERFAEGHPLIGLAMLFLLLAACISGVLAWAMWIL